MPTLDSFLVLCLPQLGLGWAAVATHHDYARAARGSLSEGLRGSRARDDGDMDTETPAVMPLMSGDWIHLELRGGVTLGFNVADDPEMSLQALPGGTTGKASFLLRRGDDGQEEPGISSGDTIFLVAPSGNVVDTEDGVVRARWSDFGDFQGFTIAKVGGGLVYPDDEVFLMVTHTGALLGIDENNAVLAKGNAYNERQRLTMRRPAHGVLHSIVGVNGVLMISMDGQDGGAPRSARSLEAMNKVGIHPVSFPATAVGGAPPAQLQLTCPLKGKPGSQSWCKDMGGNGHNRERGCTTTIEQAITDSHRRAMVAALSRPSYEQGGSDWTVIVEDDVVPLQSDVGDFDQVFNEAWQAVPPEAKMVRLGWCTSEAIQALVQETTVFEGNGFRLVRDRTWMDKSGKQHYYTGGCTTSYMVHRSIIPELLKVFPCCCAIDCCLQRNLFHTKPKNNASAFWRGTEIMIDIDAPNAREASTGLTAFQQNGIFFQDHRAIATEGMGWSLET